MIGSSEERQRAMRPDDIRISVIIPVYNGEKYLGATIESVLAQTYRQYELILVDDGSTDRSPAICDEYAARDSRIKVIHQANGGAAHARDIGIQNAKEHTGIVFLDDDDLFHPRMLEDMAAHEGADMVCTCYSEALDSRIQSYQFDSGETSVQQMSGRDMLRRLFEREENKGNVGMLWGILFKREFLRRMLSELKKAEKELPHTYMEDVYCVPQFLFHAESVTLLNRVYIFHRVYQNSFSHNLKPNAYAYELPLANRLIYEFYNEHGCTAESRHQLVNFYLTTLKLWYQIVTHESDQQKREEYLPVLLRYYEEFYPDMRRVEVHSVGEAVTKYSILLFRRNRLLWKLLVGDVHFRLLCRF